MKSTTINCSMLKKVLLSFVLVLSVMFSFVACGTNVGFDDGPTSTDVVIGNGTSAVVYGDYVYYVNGYKGYSEVGDSNVYGKVTYSAVYRTKLVDGKVVENEKELDEDGNEVFDKTQGIQNTGVLVSKVCGFEATKLYIFDGYLYYTTPGNQVDKDGTIESDHIDFCRIKIDGHSRGEKLFTSDSVLSSVSFYMYQYAGKAYLIVKDDAVLKIAECGKNSFSLKTLDADDYSVSSIAPTRYTRSDEVVSAIDNAVYFTYTNENITTGNMLAKYDLATKKVEDLSERNDSTYTLLGSVGGKLYYNKQLQTSPGTSGAYLYYNSLDSKTFVAGEHQLSNNAYTASNIYLFNADKTGAYVNDGTNIYCFNSDGTKTKLIDGSATIVAQKGDMLFYTLDNTLYRLDVSNAGATAENLLSLASADAVTNTLSVVSADKVFYLKEYTNSTNTSYYMHILDTSIQTDDGNYDHFIGVLEEKDYLDEESE